MRIHNVCVLLINLTTIFNCVHFLDQRSNVKKHLTVSWTGERFNCANFALFELRYFGGWYWWNSHPLVHFTNCAHRQWWHMNQKTYQCWGLCWEGLVPLAPRRVLPMMAYTGRLHPKGGFHLLKDIKGQGNLSFGSVKGPRRANRWILWLYKVEKTFYFCDWFLFKRQVEINLVPARFSSLHRELSGIRLQKK